MIRIVLASVVLFAVLAAVYMATDFYLRWTRRRALEKEYATSDSQALSREDFVDRGLAQYNRSTERKLLIGIFFLPLMIIGLLAFFIN